MENADYSRVADLHSTCKEDPIGITRRRHASMRHSYLCGVKIGIRTEGEMFRVYSHSTILLLCCSRPVHRPFHYLSPIKIFSTEATLLFAVSCLSVLITPKLAKTI